MSALNSLQADSARIFVLGIGAGCVALSPKPKIGSTSSNTLPWLRRREMSFSAARDRAVRALASPSEYPSRRVTRYPPNFAWEKGSLAFQYRLENAQPIAPDPAR